MFVPIGRRRANSNLPAGEVFRLDAGLVSSWAGSGSWANVVASPADGAAQSAYNFTPNNCQFNGTPGNLTSSEYWQSAVETTRWFELSANTSFIHSLHKPGAAWTWLVWYYFTGTPPSDNEDFWFDTGEGSESYGVGISNFNTPRVVVYKNISGTLALQKFTATPALGAGLFALSLKDSTLAESFFYNNGNYLQSGGANTWVGQFSGAVNTAAAHTPRIMRDHDPVNRDTWPTSVRLYQVAMYNRNLNKTELDAIWNTYKSRYAL